MPAEWEPHEATWVGWPANPRDWPGKFRAIPFVYCEIARKVTAGERLRVLVRDGRHEASARLLLSRAAVDLSLVDFHTVPTDRNWTRDMGPIFVKRDGRKGTAGETAVVDFRFTAWARYPNFSLDAKVHRLAAKALGKTLFPAKAAGRDFVLEGGAIDVNGAGTLLTTEECLLDAERQVRNPGLSRKDTEEALSAHLGVTNVVWLGKGIEGDDTHGHVDDLCRFTDRRTVVLCEERNGSDPNHRILEENRERLEGARLEDGARFRVVRLPMPSPLSYEGIRLPASYANFYVCNGAVLVPTFNDPKDREALGILAELFPGRSVCGIHAVDLVWGFGTLHCLTQQQPAT
jgi:agmatine deiminase